MKLTKILAAASVCGAFALASCGTQSKALSHADFIKAEVGTEVSVQGYIQDRCTWYNGAASFYFQDSNGGYYVYNLACTEDEYKNTLTVGADLFVTSQKAEWRGEVEVDYTKVTENAKWEIASKSTKVYPATKVADIATATLDKYKNTKVATGELEVTKAPFTSWEDYSLTPAAGADVYFAVKDSAGNELTFVVEAYLEDSQYGSATYTAVTELAVGDKVELEGFVYYYDAPQMQVTKCTKK